ncbi:tumor necrosis factor receptor superfamily member 10B-like [Dendropsophus ebraccatus]|uniref:tumor necrosis factor receptor superfamily member 10B-like n=1 Tax=Dendropsophus ebraccatus TaxID=150705 RepID=UPI00383162A2
MSSLQTITHTYRIPVKRDYDPEEIYYMHGAIRCFRCQPGTFVQKPCIVQDTAGTCAPCLPGHTYSEHLSGMDKCLKCTVCRSDEEEVSQCTITKNTVCKCKEGTYCPPGAPCEVCQKCTKRCPPDQVIQKPCNSTSDVQCGPPETASNTTAIIVSVAVVGTILLVAFCTWFCYCRKKCDRSRWIPKLLTVPFKCDEASAGDTETPFLPQTPELRFKENITENEKNEVITKTFHIFIEKVPMGEFEKFMRVLGLTHNEIECARRDNADTYSRCYAMLFLLHQDKKFDVNIWLKKLCDIKLRKVSQDIAKELTNDGLFKRTSQG